MCLLVCPRCTQEGEGCTVHGEFRKNNETTWKSGSFFLYSHGCPSKWFQSKSVLLLLHWPLVTQLGNGVKSSAWYRNFSMHYHSIHCHYSFLWSSSSHYHLRIFQWFPPASRNVVQTQPAIQGSSYLLSALCSPSHILSRHFLLTYRKTKRIFFLEPSRHIVYPFPYLFLKTHFLFCINIKFLRCSWLTLL